MSESKYNDAIFKIILFSIVFVFGAVISGWNWVLNFICAIIILSLFKIRLAYDKGKKDGRREYLKEKRFKKQVNYSEKSSEPTKSKSVNKMLEGKSFQIMGQKIFNKESQEKPDPLVDWLRDSEQIPEEGESVDEFIKRTGWTLEEENKWRKIDGLKPLTNKEEYRDLFDK